MRPERNLEAISKVMAADLRGDSMSLRKPLYIEQNAFDIALDTPIFRIAVIDDLLDDIENKCLTHTRIGPMIWGDPAENPLLEKRFPEEVTGCELSLEPLIEDLFGVCWSLFPSATPEMWSYYSYGRESIRIQSTPKKLLEGVMDLRNPYFMLQHFIGKIEYVTEAEFDTFYEDQDFTKYLDSLGQRIVLSVLKLPDDASAEEEVRLVYRLERNQEWVKNNVKIKGDGHIAVPFCWDNVIDGIVTNCTSSTRDLLEAKLHDFGIDTALGPR
ncbi:hypothetical protein [Methylomicrobium album]|uniref:DUF2971 family protein n=1 Tax=Methylomicrobium album BG8 TaxID=686340 RepID=H8GPK7_METAL|nr:hypothetical protein [Methylomicrobium album]EIC28469.1 hypothetical protein Metal_0624 [Methylomicrobium album BG8]